MANKQQTFSGDVAVTGNLTVTGQIISQLQQQVNQLASSPPSAALGVAYRSPALLPSSSLTTTPTAPTIETVSARLAIVVGWDFQEDLADFQRYEIQCSPDGSTWYAPSNNMTSGLGTLNAVVQTSVELYVHMLPSGTTMYYRVRRVNKVSGADNDGPYSPDQSNVAGSTSSPNVGAATIYCQTLVVGDLFFTHQVASQTNNNPQDGDYKSVLTKSSIQFSRYFASISAWVALASTGIGAAATLSDSFVSGRSIANDTVISGLGRYWTGVDIIGEEAQFAVASIAFGPNGIGIALAQSPTLGAYCAGYRTTDGVNWSAPYIIGSGNYQGTKIATDGNGHWIATLFATSAQPEGPVMYSGDDGVTWQDVTPTTLTGHMLKIASSGSVWMLLDTTGNQFWTSSNPPGGWSSAQAIPAGSPADITYVGGYFIMLGNTYYVKSSDNGASWRGCNFPTLQYFACTAYQNGVWIVGGYAGSTPMFWRSTDGMNFTAGTLPSPMSSGYSIAAGNGIFVMTDTVGNTTRSIDLGLSWGTAYGDNSSSVPSGMATCGAVAFAPSYGYGGRFYTAGGTALSGGSPCVAYSDYVEAGSGIEKIITNASGTAVLYSNGWCEQWTAELSITTNATLGAIFYYNGSPVLSWPMPFVTYIGSDATARPNPNACWASGIGNTTGFTALMFAAGNGDTGVVRAHGVGYWK